MKLFELYEQLASYAEDKSLSVITVKQLPNPVNTTELSKFGLELQHQPMPVVVGSILEVGLLIVRQPIITEEFPT